MEMKNKRKIGKRGKRLGKKICCKIKEFKLKEDTVADDYTLDDMLNDNEGVGVDKSITHALKEIEKTPVKDQVRFSDQIKTKLKNMKQIQ